MSSYLDNLSINNYTHAELYELWETSIEELTLIYYNYLSYRKQQLAVLYKLQFTVKTSRRLEYQWLQLRNRLINLNVELWEYRKIVNIIMYTMKCKRYINSIELRQLNCRLVQEINHVESIILIEDESDDQEEANGYSSYNNNKEMDDDLFDIQLIHKYPSLTKRIMKLETSLIMKYRYVKKV